MATALRPLTLGELLDRVFQLYRRNVVLFCGLAGIPYAAVLALQLATLDYQRAPLTLGWGVTVLAVALAGFVANSCAQAGTVSAVSQLYLGQTVSIGETFGNIRSRVLRLCLMSLALGIIIGLGFIALILPGLYLMLRWALVVPSMVVERKGIGQSMRRSAFLMADQYGRAFLIYVLFFILSLIFTSVFQVPAIIGAAMAPVPGVMPVWAEVLMQVGAFLANTFIGPLLIIAIALLYYDARVRKEAFDLEHMTSQIENAGVPAPLTT